MKYDLSREFAAKLSVMLESSLIHYKYYELWCDEIIESMDNPPYWIIDLTSTKYLPDARNVVYSYAFSEPFIDFYYLELTDFYIACKYVKYIKKHISWATFLSSAGSYSDGNSCCVECEYFYSLLSQFEESEYSKNMEYEQSEEVGKKFSSYIKESDRLYEYFLKYFRQYVSKTK
ncbi:hypothetical protein KQI86_07710 [Clostridium sp. MSJ-11]|uniref:Uncharacterized protein n=1 Tax=Clostridium mobile TaxID=2841512 RepID=A0ABS6EGP9_9CLOT|nr:hypothetical protein [Clostridium mobile]MBU5484213.1 hypothetical protein [Clostridium mobile]